MKISGKLVAIIAASVVLIAMISIIFLEVHKPPYDLVTEAEDALVNASTLGAGRYAQGEYKQAQYFLQNGKLEVAHQQGKLPAFRNYSPAIANLKLALDNALSASQISVERARLLRERAEARHLAIKSELESWRQALDGSLALYRAEKFWFSACLQDSISLNLISAGEYEAALQSLNNACSSIAEIGSVFEEYENDAGQKIEMWRKWVQETRNESSSHAGTAIVVDKSLHKLYLLRKGTIIRTYNCDLGYNSAHQKLFAGDGATPEGMYRISAVKSHGSRYYRALLLDYPNQRDKKRFADNKDKGIISRNSRIGGLIEIHGEGGRSADWTDGCVALENAEMDELMKHVAVGTPVTIVRRSDRWP